MKKIGLWAAAACSAVIMLTSCLGETKNEQTVSAVPGVVFTGDMSSQYKQLVDVGGLYVYSPTLENKFQNNDCVVTSFRIDYSSPENANAQMTGYFNVEMSACEKVDQYMANTLVSPEDTATVLPNELPIMNAIYPQGGMNTYVRGYQFLWSALNLKEKQEVVWSMFHKSYGEIEAEGEDEGYNYYSIFLRATESRKPEGDTEERTLVPNAFYLKNFIDRVNSIERSAQKDFFLIRVYYVKEIKDNKPVWAYDKFAMAVQQESQN